MVFAVLWSTVTIGTVLYTPRTENTLSRNYPRLADSAPSPGFSSQVPAAANTLRALAASPKIACSEMKACHVEGKGGER